MSRFGALGIARGVTSVAYGLGALTHVYFFTQHPELYRSVADQAVIPVYRDLWQALVVPTLAWSPAVVIAFEAGVAILVAGRGRAVRDASVAAAAFQAALAPMGPWGVLNLAIAGVHLFVARCANRGRFGHVMLAGVLRPQPEPAPSLPLPADAGR